MVEILWKTDEPHAPLQEKEYLDQILTCIRCGTEFIFSADEQRFFHAKQFVNLPKRCLPCRIREGRVKSHGQTKVKCAECGELTVVPFKPVQSRPVLCRACFDKHPKPR